jgi:hypothetical protein
MNIIRSIVALALVTALTLQGAAPSLAETVSWQDAVGQLAHERTIAESCVGVLKKYGDDAQRARGDLSYARAKAESDTVIEGLITVLSEGETPADLPGLQMNLKSSASGLVEFCDSVDKLIPSTAPGQKGVLDAIAKVTIGQLIEKLSDAVSALYINYRKDKELTRRTIRAQLKAAKWLTFSEVKAAQ